MGDTEGEGGCRKDEVPAGKLAGDMAYSYIGQKAKREYEQGAYLQIAKEMEQQGKDDETIRLATGWHKNKYSDQWEYEIDDSGINITGQQIIKNPRRRRGETVGGENWGKMGFMNPIIQLN